MMAVQRCRTAKSCDLHRTAVRQNFLIFKFFYFSDHLLHGLRWSVHAPFGVHYGFSSAQGALLGCLVTGLEDGRPVIGLCGVALQRLVTYFVLLHDDFFSFLSS